MQNRGREEDGIKVRVCARNTTETILIWNTQNLTDEQKANTKVAIRSLTDNKWIYPEVFKPDISKLASADTHTDAIAIRHTDLIHQDTPFQVKLTFGIDSFREVGVKVAGKNTMLPYIKPIRTASGIYALPVELSNLTLVDIMYQGQRISAIPVVIVGDYSGGTTPASTNSGKLIKEG